MAPLESAHSDVHADGNYYADEWAERNTNPPKLSKHYSMCNHEPRPNFAGPTGLTSTAIIQKTVEYQVGQLLTATSDALKSNWSVFGTTERK